MQTDTAPAGTQDDESHVGMSMVMMMMMNDSMGADDSIERTLKLLTV
jgi:hypothetical protein